MIHANPPIHEILCPFNNRQIWPGQAICQLGAHLAYKLRLPGLWVDR